MKGCDEMRDCMNGTIYGFIRGDEPENQSGDMREGWTLHIKDQSWVEDTEHQVDFVIQTLGLTGSERILDMACGYGRHSLALARKGFSVVGVDITKAYIDDAKIEAQKAGLNVEFRLCDIRDLNFYEEFDVVLNMADGAIGYFETDEENLVVFDKIAESLKPGGRHLMDVCNAEHAENYFPKRNWQIGTKILALPEFDWDKERRRMIYGGWEIEFGKVAQRPVPLGKGGGARLYSLNELDEILRARGMHIRQAFSDYDGKEATPKQIQLIVCSVKD